MAVSRRELVLIIGFVLCVVMGVVTVLLPELSSHDEAPAAPKSKAVGPPVRATP